LTGGYGRWIELEAVLVGWHTASEQGFDPKQACKGAPQHLVHRPYGRHSPSSATIEPELPHHGEPLKSGMVSDGVLAGGSIHTSRKIGHISNIQVVVRHISPSSCGKYCNLDMMSISGH
jgi:hypothetical protein